MVFRLRRFMTLSVGPWAGRGGRCHGVSIVWADLCFSSCSGGRDELVAGDLQRQG